MNTLKKKLSMIAKAKAGQKKSFMCSQVDSLMLEKKEASMEPPVSS